MASKPSYMVFLIGEKDTGSIEANREECPQLDIRAAHSDLACLRCGGYFPMSRLLPLDVEMVGAITKEFMRKHRQCSKKDRNKSEGLYLNLGMEKV